MATDRTENHRPLRGGIAVWPSTGSGARGTLTAVARRVSLDTKVLVTNIHVVSTSADNYTLTEGEYLYQGGTDASDRIGKTFTYADGTNSWLPVVPSPLTGIGEEHYNPGDITLLDVKNDVATDLGLHVDDGSGGHEQRPIVFPPVAPVENMTLRVFGATTGPGEARITAVDGPKKARRINVSISDTESIAYRFKNTVVLSRVIHPGQKGDSGAPCVWEDDDGNYRLVCILYGGIATINLETEEPERLTGYAMPARLAESLLGIYFGVKAPTAVAEYRVGNVVRPRVVHSGETVTLDGSGSEVKEPGASLLTYQWDQVLPEPAVGTPNVTITNRTQQTASFTAPPGNNSLEFKLTVTDSHGAKASDTIPSPSRTGPP